MSAQELPAGVVVFVAASIGAFSVALATVAPEGMKTVPPVAKCFVSGLLSGLGLIAMLPSALKERPPGWSYEHILLLFCAAPLFMFFVHHVVLDHQHIGDDQHQHQHAKDSDSLDCACEPPKTTFGRRPTFCPPVGQLPGPGPPNPKHLQARCAELVTVLLRALPYTIHAILDGAILSTANSSKILVSLAIPISLCVIQDIGTITMNLAARRVSWRIMLFTTILFGVGFPIGAALGVVAASKVSGSDPGSVETALSPLRAFAGGVFIYMATFELAPPHAHGRLSSLRYLLAFGGGLALVYLSEAVEDLAIARAFGTEANVSSVASNLLLKSVQFPGSRLGGGPLADGLWAAALTSSSSGGGRDISATLQPHGP